MPTFTWDTTNLRRASEVESGIPWKDAKVALIRVRATADGAGAVAYGRTVGDKSALLTSLAEGDCLLVAWPGQFKQDVFVVDDHKMVKHAFKLT